MHACPQKSHKNVLVVCVFVSYENTVPVIDNLLCYPRSRSYETNIVLLEYKIGSKLIFHIFSIGMMKFEVMHRHTIENKFCIFWTKFILIGLAPASSASF